VPRRDCGTGSAGFLRVWVGRAVVAGLVPPGNSRFHSRGMPERFMLSASGRARVLEPPGLDFLGE